MAGSSSPAGELRRCSFLQRGFRTVKFVESSHFLLPTLEYVVVRRSNICEKFYMYSLFIEQWTLLEIVANLVDGHLVLRRAAHLSSSGTRLGLDRWTSLLVRY